MSSNTEDTLRVVQVRVPRRRTPIPIICRAYVFRTLSSVRKNIVVALKLAHWFFYRHSMSYREFVNRVEKIVVDYPEFHIYLRESDALLEEYRRRNRVIPRIVDVVIFPEGIGGGYTCATLYDVQCPFCLTTVYEDGTCPRCGRKLYVPEHVREDTKCIFLRRISEEES
ncbi:MAG: hypothetical protein DRJ40_08260 [Thermoprotei archaeon]|nr:MAG: hypothetical protein DRJ40_08260 [Thermoprotei archaeon]